ncbi:MAG: class I SAM-dependent methyltransferase [Planctomycetota bacterium]|nr:MAG: class I SAM-dependent methyltransferase [Planctomycetota bacterium]REJ89414.1 MAG: class I SAM-dependent methyltransferase [Planctomycetota bacterium]REK26212.1 MAG: class I SAM-dependent methyltransferase [Planctomycetota bacterium]REK44544.1 MAG: class I SAM-dependent methyltransferase [Planctomycetota bacterium]
MSLTEVELPLVRGDLPERVAEFLAEADRRVDAYVQANAERFNGFVASDYVTVYHALRAIEQRQLAAGSAFCEWGCGFGVVASLAAMLDFNACGIEVVGELVDGARQLAEDFDLPVEFVHGSFVPRCEVARAEQASSENSQDHFWLVTDADDAYDRLGAEQEDFDLIFAYPWPGEEVVIEELFDANAARGALLLTYDQFDVVHLYRKTS